MCLGFPRAGESDNFAGLFVPPRNPPEAFELRRIVCAVCVLMLLLDSGCADAPKKTVGYGDGMKFQENAKP